MTDPLEQHSLRDLEDAQRRLRAHISKRRPKPSLVRRLIGLCLTIPAMAAGLYVMLATFGAGHGLGFVPVAGGAVMIVAFMWIYSDWFE